MPSIKVKITRFAELEEEIKSVNSKLSEFEAREIKTLKEHESEVEKLNYQIEEMKSTISNTTKVI